MGHAAVAELADEVTEPGQPLQLADLLDAVVGRAHDLDLDVELGRLLPVGLVLHLRVRLGHAAVELVALHGRQVPVGEMVVGVDGVPLARQVLRGAIVRLRAALRHRDVGRDDRRPRRVTNRLGDGAIAPDVLGCLRPLVLHDDEQAEAEPGHDLGRLRAHRGGVEAALRVRGGPRPDRGRGDLEELAVPVEDLLGQRLDDDLRGLDEAGTRLLHRHAEAGVLHAGRAAAEAEHAAAVREDVEQRDLLGDPHRIVPGEHDDGGTQRDALRAAGDVAEELSGRRRHGVAGEVVLEREDGVEAERLSQVAERQVLADDRGVRAPFLREHVERHPDFHDVLPADY